MSEFQSLKQAKEYLIGRIVAEAERKGVPLSEIERKMLYFSETDWTLPDILEVNAAFERECDEDEYEQKVAGLVRSIRVSATPEEQEKWDDAVVWLADGDHYLLVLIKGRWWERPARPAPEGIRRWLPSLDPQARRAPGDRMRLITVALIIMIGIIAYAVLSGGH